MCLACRRYVAACSGSRSSARLRSSGPRFRLQGSTAGVSARGGAVARSGGGRAGCGRGCVLAGGERGDEASRNVGARAAPAARRSAWRVRARDLGHGLCFLSRVMLRFEGRSASCGWLWDSP
jgi:hypothetical protein